MFKKLLAISFLLVGISANANAAIVYSNGFNNPEDLADWEDVSLGGGGVVANTGCCSLDPQEGNGYLAFTGNSSSVDSNWYGGTYLDLSSILTAGKAYELSFYWGGRGQQRDQDPRLMVGLTSGDFLTNDLWSVTFNTNTVVGEWTLYTMSFVAPASVLYLDIAEISSNSRNVGPAIDNLVIKEVSAPSVIALLGLTMIGFGLRARKR
ncbi:hypothetical protein DRW07_17600 [Alteromonas sediminis]|uniref:PEP-CTERM sorting domain-containing protein n=1 Tax=Alteromonas sediminis TaxID=2259342 RepID=A0A3N5Z4R0_9ALTE|nr:hypothetical protein [Alteromonas sediminis]RPJ65124.1 hypothetical protein DRW07_17600 [Alteromonas sediminis]